MVELHHVTGKKLPQQAYIPDDRFVLPSCNVGLELEIESAPSNIMGRYPHLQNFWEIVHEGSLRDGGVEFVLSRPLFGKDLTDAITALDNAISTEREKSKGRSFRPSERTSYHVHLDIRDLQTTTDLFSFIALYLMVERSLFRYFDDVREDNIFCLPLYRSPYPIRIYRALLSEKADYIRDMLREGDGIDGGGLYKYSALNLSPMFDYGSVEFRHAPAMWNTENVTQWVNILMCLKKAATRYDYLNDDVAHRVSMQGFEEMFYDIFGPDLADLLITRETVTDVFRGIRLTQQIQNHQYHLDAVQKYKKLFKKSNTGLSRKILNTEYTNVFKGV